MMSDSEDEQAENVINIDCSPVCWYGTSCYRINPAHFRQFRHPHLSNDSTSQVVRETVELNIEIGHNSSLRPQPNIQGHTHDWTAFVRCADQKPIEHIVQKVVFRPPAPFTHMQAVVDQAPFSASLTGHRSYKLSIEIHYKNRGEPQKTQLDYDLYLKENASYSCVRGVKLYFQNPNGEFRDQLLRAGGVILQVPDSSTSVNGDAQSEVPSSSANKRKRGAENEISNSSKDDYDVFGQLCASKLRKLDELSPHQKILAEKLITEVLFHAQQKSLSNDSCIQLATVPSAGNSNCLSQRTIKREVSQSGNLTQETIKTEVHETHDEPEQAMEVQVPESTVLSPQSVKSESNQFVPMHIKQEIE